MSQVAIVIHRHPTAIHRHPIRMNGDERLFATCQGVVEGEAHNGKLLPGSKYEQDLFPGYYLE